MKKVGITLIVSFLIGAVIFSFFLYRVGLNAVTLIFENLNIFYFMIFFFFCSLSFVFSTARHYIILRAYGKKVPFLLLMKQMIAGYSVSYVTPSIRLGGEPIRAYMLKKEAGVDLKTGTASIIMDKFVEIGGLTLFGLLGVVLFLLTPGIAFSFKLTIIFVTVFVFLFLLIFYYRVIKGHGSFSTLFSLAQLDKFEKLNSILAAILDIEKKLKKFFTHHKKALFSSLFVYWIYLFISILQMKFLLLSLGVNGSVNTIVLSLTALGVAELIPVPAALGFLEAGQAGLFSLLKMGGSTGFAVSLLLRVSALFFVALGFAFILSLGGTELFKFVGKIMKEGKIEIKKSRKLKRKVKKNSRQH